MVFFVNSAFIAYILIRDKIGDLPILYRGVIHINLKE